MLEVAGDRIDLIGTGGDIGTQRGMMLNPALWRRHIKPYTGRLIRTFKSLGYATFYHSCGSIVPVIPDLIEVGLDLLDPIQPQAAGMNPEALFEAFGDRLSFHGGIDEQELLPHGTAGAGLSGDDAGHRHPGAERRLRRGCRTQRPGRYAAGERGRHVPGGAGLSVARVTGGE